MTKPKQKSGPPIGLFVLATLMYVAWIAYGAFFHSGNIIKLDIKDWGNLLAGVFSPLAFFWLLYAALAQKAELELQRQELQANNETQREQQLQMKRQADALDAQINRLNGQADAQYQPIFVLSTSSGIVDGLQLQIKNIGADVIEVTSSENTVFVSLLSRIDGVVYRPKDRILPYWPRDNSIQLNIPDIGNSTQDQEFFFKLKRLDNSVFQYSYRYINASQRIELISIVGVD